jgi:hypothetical protein
MLISSTSFAAGKINMAKPDLLSRRYRARPKDGTGLN